MSLGSRIKEQRERLGMSRIELADSIGVAPSAIGNYENGYSTPKVELLYKIFDVLQCDANYLYQDEMRSPTPSLRVLSENEQLLVEYYRQLGEENKDKLIRAAKYLVDGEEMEDFFAKVDQAFEPEEQKLA